MKDVALLFVSIGSLIAFVLISVTAINTNDSGSLIWIVLTLMLSLGSAMALRWRYESSKR